MNGIHVFGIFFATFALVFLDETGFWNLRVTRTGGKP